MDPKIILQKSEIKHKFSKKTSKHLVFDAKKKKKSRATVDRKEKSVRVNKKKISPENSNTEQNKSTNITSTILQMIHIPSLKTHH